MGLALTAAVALSACDTSVTNPGPTPDSFLDSLVSHQAVVNGAQRALADAIDQVYYWGGAIAFELNPTGTSGSFGIDTRIQIGQFDPNLSGDWDNVAQARWTAENAMERFETALPNIPGAPSAASYEPIADAALLAGYANRILGENFCQAVFDGGAPVSNLDAFTRAEGHFTKAIQVGGAAGNQAIVDAAYAGRASVRADLATYGQASWSDAVADAGQITDNTFTYQMPYFDIEQAQFNYIEFANGNEPYRAHTQWHSFFEFYYARTTDPRVPYAPLDPNNPVGEGRVDRFGGQVPWLPQMKYDRKDSPINLSSGWEMRLIEAEAALATSGDFATVNAIINNRRSALNAGGASIPLAAATTVAEGWVELKLERQLELWLEGRRMWDLRRWSDNNVGGGLADVMDGVWEDPDGNPGDAGYDPANGNETRIETMTSPVVRELCYPIGQDERQTNPKVP